jgi:hypothetical protein
MEKKWLVVFTMLLSFNFYSQVTESWVMETLRKYSPSSYSILYQYEVNGNSISYENSSISSNMGHLEYCKMDNQKNFLSSISTTVHETTHAYDSQIPYMLAKQGLFKKNNFGDEGFCFDENTKIAYAYPEIKFFQSRELSKAIQQNLRTFRFETYIESKSNTQSTQSSGIIGLMEEFNAYYHGSKVQFDLLPVYKEAYGNNFLWSWSSNFTSNADAFYEFDFWIKEYLLYAKTNNPQLYESLKSDQTFKTIYKNIRSRFSNLIAQYERKYDEYTVTAQKSKEVIYSSQKHSNLIYPILSEQIKSTKYAEIERCFLAN